MLLKAVINSDVVITDHRPAAISYQYFFLN